MSGRRRSEERQNETKKVSPWEWVAAGLGLFLVLGAVLFLAVQAFRSGDVPPAIVLEAERTVAAGDAYLVEFSARNAGSSTVAGLHISGEMVSGDSVLEASQTVIDFVPAGGTRSAGLFFEHDPREHELRMRAVGFDLP